MPASPEAPAPPELDGDAIAAMDPEAAEAALNDAVLRGEAVTLSPDSPHLAPDYVIAPEDLPTDETLAPAEAVDSSVPFIPASEIESARAHLSNGAAKPDASGRYHTEGGKFAPIDEIEKTRQAEEAVGAAKLSDVDKSHLGELRDTLAKGELPEGFKVDYKAGETTATAAARHLAEVEGRFAIDTEIRTTEANEVAAKEKAVMDEIEATAEREQTLISEEVGELAASLRKGASKVAKTEVNDRYDAELNEVDSRADLDGSGKALARAQINKERAKALENALKDSALDARNQEALDAKRGELEARLARGETADVRKEIDKGRRKDAKRRDFRERVGTGSGLDADKRKIDLEFDASKDGPNEREWLKLSPDQRRENRQKRVDTNRARINVALEHGDMTEEEANELHAKLDAQEREDSPDGYTQAEREALEYIDGLDDETKAKLQEMAELKTSELEADALEEEDALETADPTDEAEPVGRGRRFLNKLRRMSTQIKTAAWNTLQAPGNINAYIDRKLPESWSPARKRAVKIGGALAIVGATAFGARKGLDMLTDDGTSQVVGQPKGMGAVEHFQPKGNGSGAANQLQPTGRNTTDMPTRFGGADSARPSGRNGALDLDNLSSPDVSNPGDIDLSQVPHNFSPEQAQSYQELTPDLQEVWWTPPQGMGLEEHQDKLRTWFETISTTA